MSKTHNERKDHAIKDHKFPHDFYDFKPFHIKSNDSKDEDVAMECSDTSEKTTKKKSIHFQFGHKANKSFQSKPSRTKDISMKDLMDVLPN
jgi:hypothetical protein